MQTATRPTAKEIMAAKKQRKAEQDIKRKTKAAIGNRQADRNTLANIEFKQKNNRLAMQEGAPCEKEENTTDEIRSWFAYQDLVYYRNLTLAHEVFEKLIRAMRCIAKIYDNNDFLQVISMAEAAIERNAREPDLSPNQRRAVLITVRRLINYQAAYAEITPAKTVEAIAYYCSAIEVSIYSTDYFDNDMTTVAALNKIIKGESLRKLATAMQIKQNTLRDKMLSAAYSLYRIAQCFDPIPMPKGIPDLRQKEWQPYSDGDWLNERIRYAVNHYLIPFEQNTGIQILNYKSFAKKIESIEMKLLVN